MASSVRTKYEKLSALDKIRKYGLTPSQRRIIYLDFTVGFWSDVFEYGDRNGEEEPCVCIKDNKHTRFGMKAYQAAYAMRWNTLPDGCVDHRCANRRNKSDTLCCTVSHMRAGDQTKNRGRSVCHRAIRIKANSLAQSHPGLRRAVKIGNKCTHRKDGTECCFISYGQNLEATNSVKLYVLSVNLL